MVDAGMDREDALTVAESLGDLEPEDGKSAVSSWQKQREIADMPVGEDVKEAALETIMGEAAYGRYLAARDAGISTGAYFDLLEDIRRETFDRTGKNGSASQADVTAALEGSGLTDAQKRSVWESYEWKKESPW